MQYRPGTCSDCNAQYKLPSSFQADKAKCKKCGGVVNIGPATEDAPKQDELVEHKPSGKKGSGPSMKERLLAERQAAAAAAAKPAAKAKPASKAPAKPAAKKAPVRRARATAKDEDGGESKRPARAGARRGAGAGSRSSARRAGRGRAAAGDDGDEEEGGRTRRGAAKKKSPMGPLLLTLGLLILVGGGAWWKFGSTTEAEAATGDETVADANDGTTPADGAGTDGSTPEDGTSPDGTTPEDGAGDADTDDTDDTPPPADTEPAKPAEIVLVTDPADLKRNEASGKYKIAIVKATNSDKLNDRISKLYPDALYDVHDPAETAIEELEPFPRFEGTSDEEWETIQQNVAKMLENSGRDSDVAGRSLATDFDPQHVLPAIINAMLKIDFLDERDARNAEFCLQRLNEVVKRRFGWTYHVNEPNKAAIMNRRIVAELYSVWSRILSGEKEWSDWYMNGKGKTQDADRESTDELGG